MKLSPMVAPALRHRPSFFSTERDAQGATSMAFGFDGVYEEPENTALYRQHVKKVMQSAMDGINGTVFAYGQVRVYATWTQCKWESRLRFTALLTTLVPATRAWC